MLKNYWKLFLSLCTCALHILVPDWTLLNYVSTYHKREERRVWRIWRELEGRLIRTTSKRMSRQDDHYTTTKVRLQMTVSQTCKHHIRKSSHFLTLETTASDYVWKHVSRKRRVNNTEFNLLGTGGCCDNVDAVMNSWIMIKCQQ